MSAPIEQPKPVNFFYSIALNLAGRTCLVVGGGSVAERKTQSLLAAGADVVLVAEEVSDTLKALPLRIIDKRFSESDIDRLQPFLVLACTNDREVNHQVASLCRQRNILVNVADNAHESDFIVQSSFHRNDLLISFSTNAQNPGFAKKLRAYLEQVVDEDFADALDITAALRDEVLAMEISQEERQTILRRIDLVEVLQLLQKDKKTNVLERMRECLFSS